MASKSAEGGPETGGLPIAELTSIYKLLSDETRLRVLALLHDAELAVGELQKILGAGQSTLSTQLGALKEMALVSSRKEGQKVFYHLPHLQEDSPKRALVEQALAQLPSAKWYERDQRELRKMLETRAESSRAFFNSQAIQNMPSPGQTWRALATGFIRLLQGERIVDLGCGNGRLAILLAEAGNTVVGVDNSEEQIKLARSQAGSNTQCTFLQAPMEQTGLPEAGFSLAILSQSLHHAAKPEAVIAEAGRLLKVGGRLLVLDLLAHEEEWLRSKFGDFWLGFSQESLRHWMDAAGLETLHSEITAPNKAQPDLEGLLVVASKTNSANPKPRKTAKS
jgi:2-polyprenyl-3-methyl-5-hydroxy-6-metoxy-1,4-benzoquinol methylase